MLDELAETVVVPDEVCDIDCVSLADDDKLGVEVEVSEGVVDIVDVIVPEAVCVKDAELVKDRVFVEDGEELIVFELVDVIEMV